MDLIPTDKLPDVFQEGKTKVTRLLSGEEVEIFCDTKNIGGYTFFDEHRASAILALVDADLALPLPLEQRAGDRRPPKDGCICVVKNVVKPVVVWLHDIVGQTITDEQAVAALEHIPFIVARLALVDVNLQGSR